MEEHLSEVGGAILPGSTWCPWTSRVAEEVDFRSTFLPALLSGVPGESEPENDPVGFLSPSPWSWVFLIADARLLQGLASSTIPAAGLGRTACLQCRPALQAWPPRPLTPPRYASPHRGIAHPDLAPPEGGRYR